MLLNVSILGVIMIIGFSALVFFNKGEFTQTNILTIGFTLLAVIALIFFFSLLSYRKKGFAFRNHDVLYRSGIIATSTMVIPYNRIQHVALHEGLVSRYYGLAKIEIFTAGGNASDIEIPGIEKAQAEDIKQLLMGKIQKQL